MSGFFKKLFSRGPDRTNDAAPQPEPEVPAAAADVFAVLSDGWSYAGWVVGNSHIRDVDRNWPDVGARIHHSVGAWPLQIHDVTKVRAVEPGRYTRTPPTIDHPEHLLIAKRPA